MAFTSRRASKSAAEVGLIQGHRSGLEDAIAGQLASHGIVDVYETLKIEYVKPQHTSKYTPDFPLPNGVIVESKGRFMTEDRQKHLLVKSQHPKLDIRFVFSNPNQRISKTSATTYAMWCEKHGFQYASKRIPEAWIKEKPKSK